MDQMHDNILERYILLHFDELDQNPNDQKLLFNSKNE